MPITAKPDAPAPAAVILKNWRRVTFMVVFLCYLLCAILFVNMAVLSQLCLVKSSNKAIIYVY